MGPSQKKTPWKLPKFQPKSPGTLIGFAYSWQSSENGYAPTLAASGTTLPIRKVPRPGRPNFEYGATVLLAKIPTRQSQRPLGIAERKLIALFFVLITVNCHFSLGRRSRRCESDAGTGKQD